MSENKLDKTIAGFENTKQRFKQSNLGKTFAIIRNLTLAAYLIPMLVSIALVLLQPSCTVIKMPLSVSGCQLMGFDMNQAVSFYANWHVFSFISVILFIMIIKALFMIKFINIKIGLEE